jgi:hypothetical protein
MLLRFGNLLRGFQNLHGAAVREDQDSDVTSSHARQCYGWYECAFKCKAESKELFQQSCSDLCAIHNMCILGLV